MLKLFVAVIWILAPVSPLLQITFPEQLVAVMETVSALQNLVLATEIVGAEIPVTTEILIFFETSSQLFLQETVYIELEVGETEIWAVVAPVDQRIWLLQPLETRLMVEPEQTVESEKLVFMANSGKKMAETALEVLTLQELFWQSILALK